MLHLGYLVIKASHCVTSLHLGYLVHRIRVASLHVGYVQVAGKYRRWSMRPSHDQTRVSATIFYLSCRMTHAAMQTMLASAVALACFFMVNTAGLL